MVDNMVFLKNILRGIISRSRRPFRRLSNE